LSLLFEKNALLCLQSNKQDRLNNSNKLLLYRNRLLFSLFISNKTLCLLIDSNRKNNKQQILQSILSTDNFRFSVLILLIV